jgi:imidazolonepropionase-like amidohydrolase
MMRQSITTLCFALIATWAHGQTVFFKDGNWFDGEKFVRRSFYSVNGVLRSKPSGKVDTTYDLRENYLLPPFADAHTHNLDGAFQLTEQANNYVQEGTAYVMVLTNYSTGAQENRPSFNKPGALDVLYANGGITSTLGHPFMAYEPRAIGINAWWDPSKLETIKKSRTGEGKVYWFFDSVADVDAKWDAVLQAKPDIIKIYLLNASNYEALRNNGKAGDKGLSETVAAHVVQKAHAAKLRVAAHIESFDDFKIGIRIGVDIFAHLPFYNYNGVDSLPPFSFSTAERQAMQKRKIFVVPTLALNELYSVQYDPKDNYKPKFDSTRFKKVVAFQHKMMQVLSSEGIQFLCGSDKYGSALVTELDYWNKHNFFSIADQINIASVVTPQVLFPGRKIGVLKEGYEASFIVLNANPLSDWMRTKKIAYTIKQGKPLSFSK